jgi:ABC-2 type transport system permease protein
VTEQSTAPQPTRRPPEQRDVRVVSARSSVRHRFAELWRTRELLVHLTQSDIKVKYKNSALGLLWSMVSPLMQLAIFWLVFGFILKNGYPHFVVFLFAGLIAWNFFSGSLNTATGIIVERAGIVKKVAFPREILPLSTVGAQIFYFSMQALAMAVILVILQATPDWSLLWLLVPAMAALLVLASGFSVLLSALNVKLRDMRHLIEVAMQLWFWLTPIVYPYEKLAPHLQALRIHGWNPHLGFLYLLNPMTPIVLTFQRVLYPHLVVQSTNYPQTPTPRYLAVLPTWGAATYVGLDLAILAFGALLLVFAVRVFGRLEGNFAEEL